MRIRSPAEWPMILAVGFLNWQIVDAGMAGKHQAIFIELPVLVAIGAEPVARIIVILVGEAHRDAIALKRPQLFDQSVVKFARPLSSEKGDDLLSSNDEF